VTLCSDEGFDQYVSLFEIFGSHYVSSVVMGGNLWVESEQVVSDESSSKEISVSMELSLSYMTASGGPKLPICVIFFFFCRHYYPAYTEFHHLSGKIKASYDTKQKERLQKTSSKIRFVANGGGPLAARMVTEMGDRGGDSPDFSRYFELWLDTIVPKPQIAKFTLRPIYDVSGAAGHAGNGCFKLFGILAPEPWLSP
jgi:hypothetical protein